MRRLRLEGCAGIGSTKPLSEETVTGPVGELAVVTLGNRMGHCMGLRIGYSMSTVLSSKIGFHISLNSKDVVFLPHFLGKTKDSAVVFNEHFVLLYAGCRSRRTRSGSCVRSWSS